MKILCIKTSDIPAAWIEKTRAAEVPFFSAISDDCARWVERSFAEEQEEYRQLIPYILIQNTSGEFLCYPRHGTEKRLHGFYSCGIGGHIDISDRAASLLQTVQAGLERELAEELANYTKGCMRLQYRGIVNETETAVSRVHLALVYLARCDAGYVPEPGAELAGAVWKSRAELEALPKEGWSALALQLCAQDGGGLSV